MRDKLNKNEKELAKIEDDKISMCRLALHLSGIRREVEE